MTEAALAIRGEDYAAPAVQPAPQSETAAVISMIERAARDPSVDMDKMERLMRMRKEIIAEQAEREFLIAMSAAQAEMKPVARDAQNDHTKSHYARLETIADAIVPIYTKHGFSLSFAPAEGAKEGYHRIACVVGHSGGHKQNAHADLPADIAGSQGKANKTAIQAFGSTMSYGRRYLTLMIFNIVLKTEDNDGNSVSADQFISDEQIMELRDLITSVDAQESFFLKIMKVESLGAIYASRFKDAVALIKSKGERR